MSVFWTRSQSEVDPKKLLEGKIEGKRGPGRPRVTWMKKHQEWLGHTYNGRVRRAEYRKSWRFMIADLYQQMELDDDDEVTLNE